MCFLVVRVLCVFILFYLFFFFFAGGDVFSSPALVGAIAKRSRVVFCVRVRACRRLARGLCAIVRR